MTDKNFIIVNTDAEIVGRHKIASLAQAKFITLITIPELKEDQLKHNYRKDRLIFVTDENLFLTDLEI